MSLIFFVGLLLQGCSSVLPVPGGNETCNEGFYKTEDEFLSALKRLNIGMEEEDVFLILGRKKEDLSVLDREDILNLLYGGKNSEIYFYVKNDNIDLSKINGYRFTYKVVQSEHGFSSPIRIRTKEHGYNYTVSLVFQNERLRDAPIVSGGPVNKTHSATVFDYLSPKTVLNHAQD
ncbi:MAG: hypothetical protein H6855_02320 [Rhodospirillales bacterium]|nr:hypothetical protein [Rhodospirillales bacterium]MCB9964901.1 hypothetical protein [Rhodospirillales bacterium]